MTVKLKTGEIVTVSEEYGLRLIEQNKAEPAKEKAAKAPKAETPKPEEAPAAEEAEKEPEAAPKAKTAKKGK